MHRATGLICCNKKAPSFVKCSSERGCPFFEKKNLSALRTIYSCLHSGNFYGTGITGVASCRYRGCLDYRAGLYTDKDVDLNTFKNVFDFNERGIFNESCCDEASQVSGRNYKGDF